jgi:hypothetical protein
VNIRRRRKVTCSLAHQTISRKQQVLQAACVAEANSNL